MINVIGVRFRSNGRMCYYLPGSEEVSVGNHVIVETARGLEYGAVVFGPQDVSEKSLGREVRVIEVKASRKDFLPLP